jgi:hypothetical protein
LNIVASALMPDVQTDTFGPGDAPALAAAGWVSAPDHLTRRRTWTKPAGDEMYREIIEKRNAIVASVGVMSDLELEQVEQAVGVTVATLPESVFPATSSDSRWTGGFEYAPENQYAAQLADPCGQKIDLPGLPAPVLTGANSDCGAAGLSSASYDYVVTAVNANGQSLPSNEITVVVTSGSALLDWTQYAPAAAASYNVFGRTVGAISTLRFLANTTDLTYCDDGSATPGSGAPPTSNTSGGPGNYGNLPMVGFIPFLIQVEDECSTFGWQERDFTGRALRLLDNATPNAIEREFWTGAFAQNTLTGPMYQSDGPGLNGFLQQSATMADGGTGILAQDLTPGAGPPSITRGVQILEDYLANSGFGGQGMIHVAPETSPNLLGARRVGSLLLSIMDNIIVPGSGYPTSGATGPAGNADITPGAGYQWIFASDLVSIRLDEPMVWPTTMAEATDRGTFGSPNTTRIRAQRYAAVTTDWARLAAVRVALST